MTIGTTSIQVIFVSEQEFDVEMLTAGLSVHNIVVKQVKVTDEELIEELARGRYDNAEAVILDITIGELSGLQVARRLRANGDSRPLIVVAPSEEDKPAQSELMTVQGVLISKPFNFDQISDTIKRVTAHS